MLFNNMVNQGKGASMMIEKKMDKQVKYNGGGRSAGTKRLWRTTVIFFAGVCTVTFILLRSRRNGGGNADGDTNGANDGYAGTDSCSDAFSYAHADTEEIKGHDVARGGLPPSLPMVRLVKTDTSYKSANVSVEITKNTVASERKECSDVFCRRYLYLGCAVSQNGRSGRDEL